VSQIEAQLNAAWNQAEPLIEKYNAVHEQYVKNKARQAALSKQLGPLEAQLAVAQEKVSAMAAMAYKGGRADPYTAFLTTTSPGNFVDQLTFINVLAREETDQLSAVRAARDKYNAQKAPVDALVIQLARQDADLAAQRRTIESRLAQLQKLRSQAYGSAGGGIGRYRPWTCPSEYLNTKGYKAAAFACKQAGKPYVWAAGGPSSYDCSGLTMASWRQVGIYLPHNAYEQSRSMRSVSRASIAIGDLVFYYSDVHHVAIYVGGGHVMAAPQAGDVVRMQDMDLGPIHSIGRPG